METNKEIKNEELKKSMKSLIEAKTEENENIFIDELRKAYFLVPTLKNDKNSELTIMLLVNNQNEHYFQAYTDMDSYNEWQESSLSNSYVLTFDEYAHIISSSDDTIRGMVLNPFNENIIIDKDTIKDIFNMDKMTIDQESSCDEQIVDTIEKIITIEQSITKAYIFNAKKENVPGYLLVLENDHSNQKELFSQVGNKIIEEIGEINIDIIDADDEIAKEVISQRKPFYEKK